MAVTEKDRSIGFRGHSASSGTAGKVELRSLTVVDFAVMTPEIPAPQQTGGYHPQKHGTWAQWVAPAITLLIGIIMVSLQVHYRNVDSSAKSSDEHVNTLIRSQIDPAKKDINDHTDKSIKDVNDNVNKIGDKIATLSDRVAHLEGPLSRRISNLEHRADQQVSLAKLVDPNRVLATIRAELQFARDKGKTLPVSDLNDYRNAVQLLPASAREYWMTVAAIINYQSLLDQMSGEAPNPAKVAKPCIGENFFGNVFSGGLFRNCRILLDTETFLGTTFENSVVIYRGGLVTLSGTNFINCTFVLELPEQYNIPANNNFLLALLNSPDQKNVRVTR